MGVSPAFPDNPTTEDIFRARIFEEPLVPTGAEPTPGENSDFAAALTAFAGRGGPDDFSALTEFLDAHPRSPWSGALLTNLGLVYYRRGHYSLAVGYAPGLAVTGLHALDGTRHLLEVHHAGAMLCQLAAHHSDAIVEAEERGLAGVSALEFEPAPYVLSSMLTCCDMITSPDGELVPADRRLAEIHHRYGPGHPVSRSI
jgi:hypothetical protein